MYLKLENLVYNDMVMVYNILHRHVSVFENNLVSSNNPVINTTISTKGHGFKHKTTPFRFDIKTNHFCIRVESNWNILPECIVKYN